MDAHSKTMARLSNREKILTAGLDVVHRRGFANASVRDIVQAAGVPQGSFTNHFASKEAFGLEIIDLYYQQTQAVIADTLLNEALPPLARLSAYLDYARNSLNEDSLRNGCLLGNFAAEAVAVNDMLREKIVSLFDRIRQALATCLEAAKAAGEVSPTLDVAETAAFIQQAQQGANLLAKTYRDPAPFDRLKHQVFDKILK